jgi:hypothetical protein
MKLFNVTLNSDKVSLVSVQGVKGVYELIGEKWDWDFVVTLADGAEVLRLSREHILYITIGDAPSE